MCLTWGYNRKSLPIPCITHRSPRSEPFYSPVVILLVHLKPERKASEGNISLKITSMWVNSLLLLTLSYILLREIVKYPGFAWLSRKWRHEDENRWKNIHFVCRLCLRWSRNFTYVMCMSAQKTCLFRTLVLKCLY